jgi:hypothetical protein
VRRLFRNRNKHIAVKRVLIELEVQHGFVARMYPVGK